MQLQAGFLLDGLIDFLHCNGYNKKYIEELLRRLAFFELELLETPEVLELEDPIFSAANNIISRGLPTLTSILVEKIFSKIFSLTERIVDDTGRISYKFTEANSAELIYRALHFIDPRVNSTNQLEGYKRYGGNLGSPQEKDFLYKYVSGHLGEHFIQLFETQREFNTIIKFAKNPREGFEKYLYGSTLEFNGQNIDFSIEFPNKIEENDGVIIEIDGEQHKDSQQSLLDNMRDDAAYMAGWAKTHRIPVSEFGIIKSHMEGLKKLLCSEYFDILEQNYKDPLYKTEKGLDALQLVLTPIAVARIQKALLYLINSGILDLTQNEWSIAIVERDLPCGELAIEDFKVLLENLFILEGKNRKLPLIKLNTFKSEQFKEAKLNRAFTNVPHNIKKHDVLLDISVLQRKGIKCEEFPVEANINAVIRSCHSPKSTRKFITGNLIGYKPVISYKEELELFDLRQVSALRYFLQTIFRKYSFRPGQVEIINRAIQLKSVVGLLPTGSGKSLTYQISALLQPGVALIVDPIKSLMKDQVEGLNRIRIDACNFINSSVKSVYERKLRALQVAKAEVLFSFVSPERLQVENFRETLYDMSNVYNNYFSYCIIDEVHCVSEWGHDFRTAYLRLGENAQKFCKTKSETSNNITLIGLTATASFDVLADVQRELRLNEAAVVSADSSDRIELSYRVKKIDSCDDGVNRNLLGSIKQKELMRLLETVPYELNDLNSQLIESSRPELCISGYNKDNFYSTTDVQHTGLVFCPHRKGEHGVKNIAENINKIFSELQVGTFMGASEKDLALADASEINQTKFIGNELNLLVATKAFGMGIDKPNIRYSVHFNYPSSIEEFYQEAGRCGRDGKASLCYILYSGNSFEKDLLDSFHKNSFKGPEKEKRIIYELLHKITYPVNTNLDILNDKLNEEYGIEVNCSLWIKNQYHRLYVNKSFRKGYGYLDISNGITKKPDGKYFGLSMAEEVLSIVEDFLIKSVTPGVSAISWLQQSITKNPTLGIEIQLNKIAVGEELNPILIGFENNVIKEISDLLRYAVSGEITERIVKDAYAYCFDPRAFISNIINLLKSEGILNRGSSINLSKELEDKVCNLFWKVRDEQDTFKAIYRLSLLGVIEDYIVDYNSKSVLLKGIKRKEDAEYIESLYNYVLRYFSKQRAEEVKKEVHKYNGNSVMQKCLGYLMDFIYENIAKKRKEAIDSMKSVCEIGADRGPEEFREILSLYFNSKYYKELKQKTNNGKEHSLELVWEYIKLTEGNIDNIKHLRGACIRLLNENPDNASFLLLKSFSILMLEKTNERLIEEARVSFRKGFRIFRQSDNITPAKLIASITKFCELIIEYNNELSEFLKAETDMFFLKDYTAWLKNFNNKFMVRNGKQFTH